MKEKLFKIKSMLRENVSLKIESADRWDNGKWRVALVTERNEYPHWLHWIGDDPDKLLDRVVRYLSGKEKQPHGNNQVSALAWLQ